MRQIKTMYHKFSKFKTQCKSINTAVPKSTKKLTQLKKKKKKPRKNEVKKPKRL